MKSRLHGFPSTDNFVPRENKLALTFPRIPYKFNVRSNAAKNTVDNAEPQSE